MNKLKLIKTGILLLTLFSANGAQATLLSDLIQGGSITVNDKIFDNWSFTLVGYSDPAFGLSAANIEVSDLTATGSGLLDPGPGLAFNIFTGAETVGGAYVTGNGGYSYLDFTIGFTASVLAGSPYDIKDVSMDLTGGELSGTDNTDSGVFIQEDVYNAATKIATTDVGLAVLGGETSSNLSNSVGFTPLKSINVTNNILLWATDVGDTGNTY